jgi:hypothetical protein
VAAAALLDHDLGLSWVEQGGTVRTAHALHSDGNVWLIDPWDDAPALEAAAKLGQPRAVIQLLDRHNRDCAEIAARLGIPHLKVPGAVPDSPFEVDPVVDARKWKEVALWWEAERTLVVAEAVGTVPVFAVGRRVGMHPLLRLKPPQRRLSVRRPERLLVGHGAPLATDANAALAEALAHARSDLPKLILTFPMLLKRG